MRDRGKVNKCFRSFEMEKKSTAPLSGLRRIDGLNHEEELNCLHWEFNGKSEIMEGFRSTIRA